MNKKLVIFLINKYPNSKTFNNTITTLKNLNIKTIEISIPDKPYLLDGKLIQQAYINTDTRHKIRNFLHTCLKLKANKFKLILQFNYKYLSNKQIIKFIYKNLKSISGIVIPDIDLNEKIPSKLLSKLIIVCKQPKYKTINTYIQTANITGGKPKNLTTILKLIRLLRIYSHKKILVGFGIRSPKHIQLLTRYKAINYIIIGTIILKLINSKKSLTRFIKQCYA